MRPKRLTVSAMALILVGMSGCATHYRTRIDVPFQAQSLKNHCGVNVLAMALDYFDIAYDAEVLSNQVFIPILNGTPPALLADVATAYGLHASIEMLTPEAIERAIQADTIPVIFIPPPPDEAIGHFILVTGVTAKPGVITAHDGNHKNRRRHLDQTTYLTILLKKA